jgi:uncharacterized protein
MRSPTGLPRLPVLPPPVVCLQIGSLPFGTEASGSRADSPPYSQEAATLVRTDAVETAITIASDLLQRHFQTLVADNTQWQKLIADNMLWELPYARGIGHPPRLSGRQEVVRHVFWFLNAVENFRFFEINVQAMADPEAAVAEVEAEGLIKATGRFYRQNYVVFLRASEGRIVFLREYFDPTRAAWALDTPILGLES